MYPGCIFIQARAKTGIYMARDIGGTYRNCGTGYSLRQNDTLRYSLMVPKGEAWQLCSYNIIFKMVPLCRS